MGIELSLSVAFSVRQPSGDHGPGAGYRLPRDRHAPDQKSWPYPQDGPRRRRHLNPAFGSALNLNVHYHMLFLDGVYVDGPHGLARFRWVSAIAPALLYYTPSLALKSPTAEELTHLAHTIARRVGRYLER